MLKEALKIKCMDMGKKHLFLHEDSVISMLVRKLMVTQEQKYLSPMGVGRGVGRT